MPITPAALKQRKKRVTFDYCGETVNVDYYPSAIGPDAGPKLNALMARINAASDTDDEGALQAALLEAGAFLCGVIGWWDYLEDDGETMQPLTAENMAAQMLAFTDFILAVINAIVQDRNQGNATGTPASASSAASS